MYNKTFRSTSGRGKYDMRFVDHSYYKSSHYHNNRHNQFRTSNTSRMPQLDYEYPKHHTQKYDMSFKHQMTNSYNQQNHHHKSAPLSQEDQYRKRIADENRKIVHRHPELIDWKGIKTIGIDHHFNIPKDINHKCNIRVFDCSTIRAAIDCHSEHPNSKICLLNFADSIKPGGGYLNGRNAQEECLCRQTLLYPTLGKSYMYHENKRHGKKPEASDIMIYSPNVLVIRNDDYKMIHAFRVDIISSPAVDNRNGNIHHVNEIMTNRIRKIIKSAAENKVEVLILGAFGCGVFKNDPKVVARIFHKILIEENYKKYFRLVLFPIYRSQYLFHVFDSILANK